MSGTTPAPFETTAAAHAFALEYGGPPAEGSVLSTAENRRMLRKACRDAGIPLGAYDAQFLGWLGGWEDAQCGAMAGLILRAYEAGREAGKRDG